MDSMNELQFFLVTKKCFGCDVNLQLNSNELYFRFDGRTKHGFFELDCLKAEICRACKKNNVTICMESDCCQSSIEFKDDPIWLAIEANSATETEISKYPHKLQFGQTSYTLLLLYTHRPGHFASIINLNGVSYFLDDLAVPLQLIQIDSNQKKVVSCAIYIKL
jgi:hypothetical protein